MNIVSYLVPRILERSGSPYNKEIVVREVNGRKILLVNGIEQTGPYTDRLWTDGLGSFLVDFHVPRNILILGVGGGILVHRFREKYPLARITGVDIDGEIIRIAKTHFGLPTIPNLALVTEDASHFAKETRQTYDLIVSDLYIGNDVPLFVEGEEFLSDVLGLLRRSGRMVINYFSEKDMPKKVQRIARILAKKNAKVEVRPVLRNIFIYVIK